MKAINKTLEKALENTFGMENTISEIDALVMADDQILVDRYAAKDLRSIRIEKGKNAKKHRKTNEKRKTERIKKSHNAMDVDYAMRMTVLEEGHFDENRVWHHGRIVFQCTMVKPLKHHGKTKARVRREGKNLVEDRSNPFEDDAWFYEADLGMLDDAWWFEYENGETWENVLARRNFNDESAWAYQNSMMRANGFYDAKTLVRLNHEIEVLNQKKQSLLEEYANKIERLNEGLRPRLAQVEEILERGRN